MKKLMILALLGAVYVPSWAQTDAQKATAQALRDLVPQARKTADSTQRAETLQNIAMALQTAGDFSGALEAAPDENVRDLMRQNAAQRFLERGNVAQAWQLAAQIGSKWWRAQVLLEVADTQRKAGKMALVAPIVARALEVAGPEVPPYYLGRAGLILAQIGARPEAEKLFEQAWKATKTDSIEKHPPFFLNNEISLIRDQIRAGFREQAFAHIPPSTNDLAFIGVLTDTGQWERATLLTQNVARDSERFNFLYQIAEGQRTAGDLAGAHKTLELMRGLKLNPWPLEFFAPWHQPRFRLAQSYARLDNLAAAHTVLEAEHPPNLAWLALLDAFYWSEKLAKKAENLDGLATQKLREQTVLLRPLIENVPWDISANPHWLLSGFERTTGDLEASRADLERATAEISARFEAQPYSPGMEIVVALAAQWRRDWNDSKHANALVALVLKKSQSSDIEFVPETLAVGKFYEAALLAARRRPYREERFRSIAQTQAERTQTAPAAWVLALSSLENRAAALAGWAEGLDKPQEDRGVVIF